MQDENLTNGTEDALNPQDAEAELDIDLSEDDEDEIDWKAEAEKKDKAYNDQKTRAEIAEKKLKGVNQAKPTHEGREAGNLTTLDIIAINRANIDIDDIETVTKYARMEGIEVHEALKKDELKAILNVKSEKRNVSQASHSGASRRSSSKLSDDAILANAKKGILPESDEDLDRLHSLSAGKRG